MQSPVVLVCVDGLDPAYLEGVHIPVLEEVRRRGLFARVRAALPTVTNVNNVTLLTGRHPEEHGVVANSFLDPSTGEAVFLESPDSILVETLLERVARLGGKTALLTAKEKLRVLLGGGAHFALSAEAPAEWAVKACDDPPSIYSSEVNFWLLRVARHLLRTERPDLLYLATTDFPMHAWPPEDPNARRHVEGLDAHLEGLLEQDVVLYLTADHGMNAKRVAVDLGKRLEREGIPAEAVPIIRDRYVRHHSNLGGSAYIHLKEAAHLERALEVLRATPGVEAALPREEASRRYRLHPQRIGDIFVLGDRETVFGELPEERQEVELRSHGSAHEAEVPLFAWGAPPGFRPAEVREVGALLMEALR